MPNNAPHNALRAAVNRAIAEGAPVYVNEPALYAIEAKDGPRAKWKPMSYPPMSLELAQERFAELDEMGGGVYRIAQYKSRF